MANRERDVESKFLMISQEFSQREISKKIDDLLFFNDLMSFGQSARFLPIIIMGNLWNSTKNIFHQSPLSSILLKFLSNWLSSLSIQDSHRLHSLWLFTWTVHFAAGQSKKRMKKKKPEIYSHYKIMKKISPQKA